MEFKCSSCDYTSSYKQDLQRHIIKQKKCGENPLILEIHNVIKCEYCNKSYKTKDNLNKHYKICKEKKFNNTEELKKMEKEVQTLEIAIKILQHQTENLKQEVQRLEIENKYLKSIQIEEVPQEKRNSMYLLQEREFFNLKQPVYKIGITETVRNRMGQYPKGSKIIFIMPVDGDPEQLCLVKFRSQFIPRTDVGSEYFQGDADLMVKTVIECCT